MKRFASGIAVLMLAGSLSAQTVSFHDPTGDDDGPGTYVYPTDRVYVRGSFDLTSFTLKKDGAKTEVAASVNANLSDPWSMGTGFATQVIFIFIDKDGRAGSGRTAGLPGLNIQFAPASAWEKVIILSALQPARVKTEVEKKAADAKGDVIVPASTRGEGHHRHVRDRGAWRRRPDDLVVSSHRSIERRIRERLGPADAQGQRVRGPTPLRRRP